MIESATMRCCPHCGTHYVKSPKVMRDAPEAVVDVVPEMGLILEKEVEAEETVVDIEEDTPTGSPKKRVKKKE